MSKFLKNTLLVVLIILIVLGVIYTGITIWANFFISQPGKVKAPATNKAQYTVILEATGNTYYTDNFIKDGNIYYLQGFWELSDGKYRYHAKSIKLDEAIFGKITVRSRE